MQNDKTAKYYDIVYSEIKGKDVVNEEIQLINSLVDKGASVLDIGAGTGRHVIPLIGEGYIVEAIEPSAGMVAKIKEKNEGIKIYDTDFFSFIQSTHTETYDLIILMWNSLNEIALNVEDLKRFLKGCRNILSDGGKILINIDDLDFINLENIDHALSVEDNGLKYIQNWKVKELRDNLTISEETISVYNSGEKVDEISELITQKWWSLEEIKEEPVKLGFNVEKRSITLNKELYVILTKK